MNRNYEFVHIDVMENADKKSLENPGGEALMESMGGKGAGLPFFVIMNPKGKTLGASTKPEGGPASNIGYPSKPDEITYFMGLLHNTGKHLKTRDEETVKAYLDAAGG